MEVDQVDADELAREARWLMAQPWGDLLWSFGVDIGIAPRWSDVQRVGVVST